MRQKLQYLIGAPIFAATVALGAATGAEGLEDDQAIFDQRVRDVLIRNPEIVLEVFAILEAKNDARERQRDAALIATSREALFKPAIDEAGQIKPVVVEFVDYNCAYCRRAEAEVATTLEANPDIELVILQYPILGEQSVDAARIALAAKLLYGDAEYLRLNEALLQGGAPAMERIDHFLSAMGFNVAELRAKAGSPEIDDILTTTHELARRLNISGTPGFVTRTQIHRGFVPADALTESALRHVNAEDMNQ